MAKLEKIEDKKAEIKNQDESQAIVEDLKGKQFIVSEVRESEKKKNPLPLLSPAPFSRRPFISSVSPVPARCLLPSSYMKVLSWVKKGQWA